jgi:hypothetical protein
MKLKEDENRGFRCAEFNGDAYSRPGLVVGEELMSKSQKLEIGDNQPPLNKAKLNKMKSKEDENRVFRCAESIGDAYSSPGSLVGEEIDTQKSKTRNCEDHHFGLKEVPPPRDKGSK